MSEQGPTQSAADGGGTTITARDAADVREAVRAHRRVLVVGAGTKPPLSGTADGATIVDVSALRGVVEYEPGEFTFTARAATPVAEVAAMLAERGQYLPFDPPFAGAGATLGGSIAAGVGGSRQYRFGGPRDFLIGIRFVDGRGELVRGGGKVVKNAAGFDLPKLMVGSLGRLGILTELTFKVFPAPPSTATLRADFRDVGEAVAAIVLLGRSRFDLEALDLVPTDGGASLWIMIGGIATSLPDRLERISRFLREAAADGGPSPIVMEAGGLLGEGGEARAQVIPHGDAADHWTETAEATWCPAGTPLFKIPVTPGRLVAMDREWAARGAIRRFAVGGQTAWVAWPDSVDDLHVSLVRAGLGGVQVQGPAGGRPWVGMIPGKAFLERVAAALDPDRRFGILDIWPAA